MKKINFNDEWTCREKNSIVAENIVIPHDAMRKERRSKNSLGGTNTGWYENKDYIYEKKFWIPQEWKDNKVIIEFEGVYQKAMVTVNGKKVGYHEYGYTGFEIDLTDILKYECENTICVEVTNNEQPNSRWYTGTGIYRPVWLWILPQKHIKPGSVRITTKNYQVPEINIKARTSSAGKVMVEILEKNTRNTIEKKTFQCAGMFDIELNLKGAQTWTPDSPVLYICRLEYEGDVIEEEFGIRMIKCTPEEGFCINGERVILKGACIHHDNGLLGACAYDFAEWRKIKILKDNGYNAIRSAHNPCSKALLKACDELGMLVMDEYVDMWYIHKTKYDYADHVMSNYKDDLNDMVKKDYNHPSVIMYSIGNEVSETAQKKGIKLCGDMTEHLHALDNTRPVTCGVNIFFNFLSSIGFGVYSDKKAEKDAEGKKKAVGSEFFNNLAGIMGADFMKFGASLYPCDLKTKDAFAKLDVAGYNYGIRRYEKDLRKYKKRLILGSETFCSDAAQFMQIAEKNKRLIGDFVWSGMDYLGEVGIGAWEYEDYAPDYSHGVGWVSAGAGRIDLTGKPLAEMKYMQVAYGLEKIGIGVVPVVHTNDKHSPSAWKMSNAIESWSWNGCNGMDAIVEVYAHADKVSIFVNGQCAGTKKVNKNWRTVFRTQYEDGELMAVAYDKDNNKIATHILRTAEDETILRLCPEKFKIGQKELCYVRMKYTDEKGKLKPLARGEIKLTVYGGELLAAGSANPYCPQGYLKESTDTYYGEALAIIRPGSGQSITIKAESKYGTDECTVEIG